jgi:hypothetical protein
MNRLEELLFSILIISVLTAINIGFAFTGVMPVDGQWPPLEIYIEVQDAFLKGRRPELGAGGVYVSVVINNTVAYEYGDPGSRAGDYLARYPIIVNGSIGELYCCVVEGG